MSKKEKKNVEYILPLQIHVELWFAPFIDRNQMMRISLRKMDESLILYGFNWKIRKRRRKKKQRNETMKGTHFGKTERKTFG